MGIDSARVPGSGMLVSLQILTKSGNWAVVVVAGVVLLFVVAQVPGPRRALALKARQRILAFSRGTLTTGPPLSRENLCT